MMLIALLILLTAGVATNTTPTVWLTSAIAAYGLPLACQASRSPRTRRFGIWTAVFLVLQLLVSVFLFDADLKRLPQRMDVEIEVGDGFPGISGRQRITTDALGFRTTAPVDYTSSDSMRVLAIGGSTTEQIFIDDDATWTHLLQQALNDTSPRSVEIVNGGVSGLRSRHYLASLDAGLELRPDAAIFLVGVNDWNWHIRKEASGNVSGARWRLADATRQWSLSNSLVGRAAWRIRSLLIGDNARRQSAGRLSSLRGSLLRDDSRTLMPDAVTNEYARNIEAIARRCGTADIDCVFVTQPTGYRAGASDDYRSGFWMTPPYENYTLTFDSMRHIAALYNDWLRAFGARENMPVCDATTWIEPSYRHLYDEVHLNVAGAKAMADGLATCLAGYGWPSALE